MRKIIFTLAVFMFIFVHVNAQKLTSYAKQHKQEIAERQRVEKLKYDNACKTNSLEDYKSFLKLYPNGTYSDDIRNRIADYDLWYKAKNANTIEAYKEYKNNSTFKFFIAEADDAIEKLNAVAAWKNLRGTTDIVQIQSYLSKYPESPYLSEANKRIHELMGIEYYSNHDYVSAYNEFKEAGGRYALEYDNRTKFDVCEEYVEYKKLSSNSSEKDLITFLNKYPSSKYKDDVSNLVAVLKAKNFSIYSTDYTYNEALGYATNDYTRNIVNNYIDDSKKSYRKYKRRQRHQRVMANGGYVQFGVGAIDFGGNALSTDNKILDVYYYNVPICVKFGNFSSPIQFEVGVMPGVLIWNYNDSNVYYDYYDSDDDNNFRFHMPAFARLKLNLYKLSAQSRLYMAGETWYNVITDDALENDFSVGGGLGLAWKHWDWYVYYKQDLDNKNNLDDKFIGTSFVYYF